MTARPTDPNFDSYAPDLHERLDRAEAELGDTRRRCQETAQTLEEVEQARDRAEADADRLDTALAGVMARNAPPQRYRDAQEARDAHNKAVAQR